MSSDNIRVIFYREVADEEDRLYGNPDSSDSNFKKQQTANSSRWWRTNRNKHSNSHPTFWLIAGRETGAMDIYTLPDLQLRMSIVDFSSAPRILGHTTQRQIP